MAVPYISRAVVDGRAVADKVVVFKASSKRPSKDLTLCLIKHPGALNLNVSSNDLYSDPVSGLAVRIESRGAVRTVTAWLPQGKSMTAEQAAQLKGCVAEPAR
ncbi:MAG: hypothetical protein WBL74_12470 [Novosphingobium sp.]|uniref:hypothetical protein n=1 Tax=Novosphingobium sp. TaxID=1874826 RepID=UPI003C7A4942